MGKDKDIAKVTRGLVQIPMVGGTIAFGYNYDCDLKLTQEQAVQVAMGMIKNWKELGCKAGKLTWAHRSDGSGTTKAFTNSMEAFSNPSVEAGAKALNGITLDENLAGKNPNPTAKGAYPIASLTWILAYEKGNGRNTRAIK